MSNKIDEITNCVINNIPVRFLKYGDGEYYCSAKYIHNIPWTENCDNDTYTHKLSNSITESFKYITNFNNTFIGKWFDPNVVKYWETLTTEDIKWTDYHTFLFEHGDLDDNGKFIQKTKIYRAIKESKLKKIIICNELLIKTKILLNIDHVVIIPLSKWFDAKFDDVLNEVKKLIGEKDGKHIVLTSCGMGAKVLISELHKSYPNGIYLDIGSGLDCICTKRDSRGWGYGYDKIYNKFKENHLLPDNWNNVEYDFIYEEAYNKLGTHLPK